MNRFDHDDEERLANQVLAATMRGALDLAELGERARKAGELRAAAHFFRGAVQAAEQQALEANLQATFWVSLARVLGDLNETEEAERLLRRVGTLPEREVHDLLRMSAYDALATLLASTGRAAEAEAFGQLVRTSLVPPARADSADAETMSATATDPAVETAGVGGPRASEIQEPSGGEPAARRVHDWGELLNRVLSQPGLPLPAPDEVLCLAALVAAGRGPTGTLPVPASALHHQVQNRDLGWSIMKVFRVADAAVGKGWLTPVDDSANLPGRQVELLMGPDVPGTACWGYQFAAPLEELAARTAGSVLGAGSVTPEAKGRLLNLYRALGLELNLLRQIDDWLRSV